VDFVPNGLFIPTSGVKPPAARTVYTPILKLFPFWPAAPATYQKKLFFWNPEPAQKRGKQRTIDKLETCGFTMFAASAQETYRHPELPFAIRIRGSSSDRQLLYAAIFLG
jgi:hypothetical protein